ncbi:hypothetical protein BMS3Bbin08_01912 [bacterium BMS3Bbin08]|nr:hypothetical protein BMS3Bbin08_01912 [bacterium BMS3Bbin08]
MSEEELLQLLESKDINDIYEALGAIGKKKLKKALESLKYKALYDDDLGIQEEAIRTIRRIGGKKALDTLRFLKTTDHKYFIEAILKYGADVDQIDVHYYIKEREDEKRRKNQFRRN